MILESSVPKDFNAMLRKFKDKYPYLTAWLDSDASAAFILGEKLDNADDFINGLSIEANENPFGSYKFDIIDGNKSIAHLKSYRYGGELRVRQLNDIMGWNMTVPKIEEKIQDVIDIIEAKKLDNKKIQLKIKLKTIQSDFTKDDS